MLAYIHPATQKGLEIGPLNNPMITRDMGSIRYVDHATTEELREKCKAWGTHDISKIVDVDYVWGERNLKELTVQEYPFDYVIASHVIEHVPDLIGWLKEIREVVKVGGIVSLAIPDKRFTYDYYRQLTRPAEVLEAYLLKAKKPSARQIFDYKSEFVRRKGDFAWNVKGFPNELVHEHSLKESWEITREAFVQQQYVDVHCWVFTEVSFMKLLHVLTQLDLFDFTIAGFSKRMGHEFYVSLEAVDEGMEPEERRRNQNTTIEAAISKLESMSYQPLFDFRSWKAVHLLRKVKRKLFR
ncbi:MAG: methyltransferase domain-containing protein [Bacteroidota bacterium]